MAGNGSECAISDVQIIIINVTYTSLSLLSFVMGLITLLFIRCYNCCYRDRHQTDSMEEILIVARACYALLNSLIAFSGLHYLMTLLAALC